MATDDPADLARIFVIVLSNLFCLVPGYFAFRQKHVTMGVWVVSTGIISLLYHLVDPVPGLPPNSRVFDSLYFPYKFWHLTDHIWSISMFPVVIFYISNASVAFQSAATSIAFYVIFAFAFIDNIDGRTVAIIYIFCLLVMVVAWYSQGGLPEMDWSDFAAALVCISLGILFNLVANIYAHTYWYMHSLWHMMSFLSFWLFLESKRDFSGFSLYRLCKYHEVYKPEQEEEEASGPQFINYSSPA
jgi:hypothetical protein